MSTKLNYTVYVTCRVCVLKISDLSCCVSGCLQLMSLICCCLCSSRIQCLCPVLWWVTHRTQQQALSHKDFVRTFLQSLAVVEFYIFDSMIVFVHLNLQKFPSGCTGPVQKPLIDVYSSNLLLSFQQRRPRNKFL